VNPRDHPNAYVALSVGQVAGFVLYELVKHGVPLDPYEATVVGSAVVSAILFAGRKLGR
jgi:Holliday junction resolvasome RuvABC endonuclease subunit